MPKLQNIEFELVTYPARSVLIIQLASLPEDVQNQVLKQRFKPWSQVINYYSALTHFISSRNENYTSKSLEEYFEDQKTNNNFQGSFGDFINKRDLLLEKYLTDNSILVDSVSEITIEC
jgi:hypothetical protein